MSWNKTPLSVSKLNLVWQYRMTTPHDNTRQRPSKASDNQRPWAHSAPGTHSLLVEKKTKEQKLKQTKKTVTPGHKVTRRRIFQWTTASCMHGLKINEGHTRLLEDAKMSLYRQTALTLVILLGTFSWGCGFGAMSCLWGEIWKVKTNGDHNRGSQWGWMIAVNGQKN